MSCKYRLEYSNLPLRKPSKIFLSSITRYYMNIFANIIWLKSSNIRSKYDTDWLKFYFYSFSQYQIVESKNVYVLFQKTINQKSSKAAAWCVTIIVVVVTLKKVNRAKKKKVDKSNGKWSSANTVICFPFEKKRIFSIMKKQIFLI